MTALVRCGMADGGLALELFQPMCLEHDVPWFGTETFDLEVAKADARVHDADKHQGVAHADPS